jgi:two-component system cell cycle response regulator DivK
MTDKQLSFLYVEDDLSSRQVLDLILKRLMGYSQVTMFEDSKNFMERLQALPAVPDIIFLDIRVAPIDGYEMLKLIRSDPAYQNTKVVALTATIMPSDVAHLQQVGFDGLLGKPLVHKIFPNLVAKILDGESIWYIP